MHNPLELCPPHSEYFAAIVEAERPDIGGLERTSPSERHDPVHPRVGKGSEKGIVVLR